MAERTTVCVKVSLAVPIASTITAPESGGGPHPPQTEGAFLHYAFIFGTEVVAPIHGSQEVERAWIASRGPPRAVPSSAIGYELVGRHDSWPTPRAPDPACKR